MPLSFGEQLTIVLIDKAVIGGMLAIAYYYFQRTLELFRSTRALELEAFKKTGAEELEKFKSTRALELETFKQEQVLKIEDFKSKLSVEIEAKKNVRMAIADLSTILADAAHCIAWATWHGKFSKTFSRENLDKYDSEIHPILGRILGARVVLAALSPSAHEQLSKTIDRLYELDTAMGEAKIAHAEDQRAGLGSLAALYEDAIAFEKALPKVVTNVKL